MLDSEKETIRSLNKKIESMNAKIDLNFASVNSMVDIQLWLTSFLIVVALAEIMVAIIFISL